MNEDNKSEDILPDEVEQKEEVNFEEENKTLKEQLAKEQEEKENYKQGMLKYKDKVKDEEPVWDEDATKFQKQTLSRAEKLAEEKARKTVEDFNEKAGIAKFKEKHPDVDIKEVLPHYNPVSGKYSSDFVYKDLEGALVLKRHYSGELANESVKAEEKGKKKGVAEAKLADLNTVSTTSQKTTPQGKTLTDGEIQIAKRMKVDLEKLAEEDLSEPATIEINQ